MATPTTAARGTGGRHRAATAPVTRYDRRLAEILTHATEVFCKKGYEGASMRDLSRESGMSLAGLYYYFESKERLLYLIQKHTFTTIVQRLKTRLEGVTDPEERIRIFILNHLEYFLASQAAMKVLSHEAEALKDAAAQGIVVVQSTRAGSGRTFQSTRLKAAGMLIADNLNPQKARILLSLALTRTSDSAEIMRIFRTY